MHRWGFYLSVGIPESGKTTYARERLAEEIRRSGCPALIIDEMGANNLDDIPLAPSLEAACRWIWEEGRNARFIPRDRDQVEALLAVAVEMGYVNILMDEVAAYLKAGLVLTPLGYIIRAHRHLRITLIATSQFFTDYAPFARSCATEAYFFRMMDPVACDAIGRYFQIDVARLQALPQGEFIPWSRLDVWKNGGNQKIIAETPPRGGGA